MSVLHNESGRAEALDRALATRATTAPAMDAGLAELVDLARTFERTAGNLVPRDEFRAASRQRLVAHMARSDRRKVSAPPSVARGARLWAARLAACVATLGISGAAAASASASSLPGDPLYPVKQVAEAAALQFAPGDSARQEILLHQADTRLDETARLLALGRESDATLTLAHYDEALEGLPAPATSEHVQSQLGTDQSRLNQLLENAPTSAQPGLHRALAATERSLNRHRQTPSAAGNEAVQAAATLVPEPGESPRPSEVADAEPTDVRPSGRAGTAEDGNDRIGSDTSAAHAKSEPAQRANAQATNADESAPAARGNAQSPRVQPGRTTPDRSGPPRPAGAGRGRP